jgi:hypothetical protein
MYTVNYQYELNIDFTTFLNNSQAQTFIETVSSIVGVDPDDHYLSFIKQGSTIVGGTLSATSLSSANSIQSVLDITIPGFTVLSTSSSIYYGNGPYIP